MQVQDATNRLYGVFMQESLRPTNQMTIDIGFRFDRSNFDINTTAYSEYDWGKADYVDFTEPVISATDKNFDLSSPKVGLTYAVNDLLNIYGLIAQSGQVPSEGKIRENQDLDAATARNIEIGIKGRAKNWFFDLSLYRTTVEDEIVSILDSYRTEFQNAEKTLKKGFELSSRLALGDSFILGANYAYSDYTFRDFQKAVRGVDNVDRAGNQIPYIPRHQYSLRLDIALTIFSLSSVTTRSLV